MAERWVIGEFDLLPRQLCGLRRHPVAVWNEPNGIQTAQRLPVRGAATHPHGSRLEMWSTSDQGVIAERFWLACPACHARADLGRARVWREKHRNKSWCPPWYCDRSCQSKAERQPDKAKRHQDRFRLAKDRDGAV